MSQLAQHTARLHNATAENEAVDAVVPAFDEDLAAIQQAYNTGTSASECIQALNQVAGNCYAYMKALVGKPGTAWIDTGSALNQPTKTCNKSCTVSCCVFYDDLLTGISNCVIAINTAEGHPSAQNDGSVSTSAFIPKVYPSSYSPFTRAIYHLQFTKPPAKPNVSAQVLQVSGLNVVATPAPPAPTAATPATSISGTLNSLLGSNSNLTLILTFVVAIVIIVTAVFGQNALRVNE
jgi:hypothetical protein